MRKFGAIDYCAVAVYLLTIAVLGSSFYRF
jgi:hypothetical protein